MPRVAIVEDHLLLAETLRAALEQSGVDTVIVPPVALPNLLESLHVMRPDLVLLDLELSGIGDSTPLIAPLTRSGIRVLVVTGATDRLRIAQALEQGALGYQLKSGGFDKMLARTSEALACNGVLDEPDRRALLTELAKARAEQSQALAPFARLTTREQAVLRALGDGRSVQQIAGDWVISEATVRSHVRGILDKTDSPSQLAAVAAARRSGWLAQGQ